MQTTVEFVDLKGNTLLKFEDLVLIPEKDDLVIIDDRPVRVVEVLRFYGEEYGEPYALVKIFVGE